MNPFKPPQVEQPVRSSSLPGRFWLGRWHLFAFPFPWAVSATMTFMAVSNNLDHAAERRGRVAVTTLGSLLVPMTGGISRDMQGCCLRFSLSLLPWCLASILIAILVQWKWRPVHLVGHLIRFLIWCVGWLGWFAGGIASLGHALS